MYRVLLPSDTLPKRRPLVERRMGDEILVRDPGKGQVHFLNATAALVWECCDGRSTLGRCLDRIREACSVPVEVDLAADVRDMLDGFASKGLLDVSARIE